MWVSKDGQIIMAQSWYLYILRCRDKSYYTGVTVDVKQRLDRHNSGKGAKYTRSRGPCELVYFEECESEAEARTREREIKGWRREEKQALVVRFPSSALEPFIRVSGV